MPLPVDVPAQRKAFTPSGLFRKAARGFTVACALSLALMLSRSGGCLAADFPFAWKQLTAQDAVLFPGYGPSADLSAVPPRAVRRQPRPVSRYPLYGSLALGNTRPLLFRIEEANGSGSGYDRLILDQNRNGDLTDDSVHQGSVFAVVETPYVETSTFGPITNPAEWKAGCWPAPLCFKVSLRNRSWWARLDHPTLIGKFEARSGWCLETTLELGGRREKFGMMDANTNFKLGEPGAEMRYGPRREFVAFTLNDIFLRDHNHTGEVENDALGSETQHIADTICIGTNVYTVGYGPNFTALRLQPYVGPFGEVVFPSNIQAATLGRRVGLGWKSLDLALDHGKARVPAGKYVLYSCIVRESKRDGEPVLSAGRKNTTRDAFAVGENQTVRVQCGTPLDLRVETRRYSPEQGAPWLKPTILLDVNVRVVGAGGEIYTAHVKGPDLSRRTPAPTFRVLDTQGGLLLTGQLEYG